jgi:RimJ/RimL family protein N-acetyltransferase
MGAGELDFVVNTERLPGYEALTARWSTEQHLEALSRPDTRYLLGGTETDRPVGFVILQPFGDIHEGTKIKRIAVSQPDLGHGRRLLTATFEWIFGQPGIERIWLDVFAHNARAIAAYQAVGMKVDGTLRCAYQMSDGRRVDRLLMSILKDEWRLGVSR